MELFACKDRFKSNKSVRSFSEFCAYCTNESSHYCCCVSTRFTSRNTPPQFGVLKRNCRVDMLIIQDISEHTGYEQLIGYLCTFFLLCPKKQKQKTMHDLRDKTIRQIYILVIFCFGAYRNSWFRSMLVLYIDHILFWCLQKQSYISSLLYDPLRCISMHVFSPNLPDFSFNTLQHNLFQIELSRNMESVRSHAIS